MIGGSPGSGNGPGGQIDGRLEQNLAYSPPALAPLCFAWGMISATMKPLTRSVVALIAIVVALLASAVVATAQPAAPVGDIHIPNGHFYSQAAPGQHGAGYRVANEAGIPFWDEFQRHGGVAKLGYPLTRRFIWRDSVVQQFQHGALRWLAEEGRSEIVDAKRIGRPPQDATRAETPPYSSGDAERYPWSGWWWPANHQAGGPRLFDVGGPLAKFDQFSETLGRPNPRTREWEQAELVFAGLSWAGHCNGWAAAALLEPEPTETRVVNGISFSVADQKGMLSSYHFADAAQWALGSEDSDVAPADFHKALIAWIGGERKGMVFTFRLAGEEVWSYPAFKYETAVGPDPLVPGVWHARTTVWLVDNDVPSNFVGGQPWPSGEGKLFEYTLLGDPNNPEGGEWSPKNAGRFGRPNMIWYPDRTRRNVDRQLASPGLDYDVVMAIVRPR